MSTTTKSKTTVTVELKKGTSFVFETPEVHKIEGQTVLVIGETNRALRFGLDAVKTVRVVPVKEDVVDELMKLYTSALKSPYASRYSYHNPFGG
ncbi:NAC domain-containing protein [Glycomyces sp. NPDC048151]|uniref:NAC domain-containing protein n=1 Tax=Glycomyces sp. NPDC048151 TaxID=3364002 RepID=UPI0037214E7F